MDMKNNYVLLEDLFYIENGVSSTEYNISDYKINTNFLPYVRPSKKQSTSYSGFIDANSVPKDKIFPEETLYVSTNGAGSHTYTYVSIEKFIPNSDVAVLIPKENLTLDEKFIYAALITKNRFKFSYGRKPKGERLLRLKLPNRSYVSKLVEKLGNERINFITKSKKNINRDLINKNIASFNSNKLVRLSSIFNIVNGLSSNNVEIQDDKISNTFIPYVRPSKRQSTSYAGFIDKASIRADKVFPAETLYVSTDGAGSHTYSYVSIEEFIPNSNVAVLIPKENMDLETKLLYAAYITANRFKFSYGRKPKGDRLAELFLPIL